MDSERKKKLDKMKAHQEEIKQQMANRRKTIVKLFDKFSDDEKEEKQDLINGGKDVNGKELAKIKADILYENWHPSQKKENLSESKITEYLKAIKENQHILPITIQSIEQIEDRSFIRTLDGRHRLTAVHQAEIEEVYVIVSDQLKGELTKQFPDLFVGVNFSLTGE